MKAGMGFGSSTTINLPNAVPAAALQITTIISVPDKHGNMRSVSFTHVARAFALLRELERSGRDHSEKWGESVVCPKCGSETGEAHQPKCELGALIGEIDSGPLV